MGVFGGIGNFQQSPAEILKLKMAENFYFPFKEVSPGLPIYELDATTDRFWTGLVLLGIDVGVAVLMYYNSPVDQYIMLHGLIFAVAMALIGYYRKKRKIVLDGRNDEYSFFIGDRLVHRDHFHNIYIRMNGYKSGGGDMYYKIALGGYEIDEQPLTRMVNQTHVDKIRKLGRRVAARLNLNYFDAFDRSRHHIIRHRATAIIPPEARRGAVFHAKKICIPS
jgi:hypothetical protein